MLHDFLTANRTALITRCKTKAAKRCAPSETPAALEHGVPLFLQQLAETLRLQQKAPATGPTPVVTEISCSAGRHGSDLLRQGYCVEQVVRDYGDVCQSVTELAPEQDMAISAFEFGILNRCLDDAIAEAVTSYGSARQVYKQDGFLCHWFTMTNSQWYTQYTLEVSGPQLSDSSDTPERIKRQLGTDNVAGNMRGRKKGGHFPWGFSTQAH